MSDSKTQSTSHFFFSSIFQILFWEKEMGVIGSKSVDPVLYDLVALEVCICHNSVHRFLMHCLCLWRSHRAMGWDAPRAHQAHYSHQPPPVCHLLLWTETQTGESASETFLLFLVFWFCASFFLAGWNLISGYKERHSKHEQMFPWVLERRLEGKGFRIA